MERIQAAIQKARATREQHRRTFNLESDSGREASQLTAAQEAWTALPEVQLNARHLRRQRVFAFENGRQSAPFDILRTRSLRQMRDNNWTRLAVTSPSAGCGKSTLTVNLALSIARQAEYRVIVIETDMRKPSLSKILGSSARRSVSDVLSGRARFQDAAVRIGQTMAVLTQPNPVENASDILLGVNLRLMLDEISAVYDPDIVIFDTPPLMASDDTLAFLEHVDCGLLVAAAGQNSVKEIDGCEKEIASQTNVLGISLNKCRFLPKRSQETYYA